ncbi:MAG: cupin domain-containing protein [Woeseiaceae bacterium]
MQTGEIEAVFTAALPGTRAQQISAEPEQGRLTLLLTLPQDWHWNTGGGPGKSVELYVLQGEITLGDVTLLTGNYAYLPPGSLGLTMSTLAGAQVLYFLDEADPHAVIRTPLYMSRDVIPWRPLSDDPEDVGLQFKDLRLDPGSGARTWLMRIAPGATMRWHESASVTEGFLLEGDYRDSECANGAAVTGDYARGGYFRRPAGVVSGGPAAGTEEGAVWLLRQPAGGDTTWVDGCLREPSSPET